MKSRALLWQFIHFRNTYYPEHSVSKQNININGEILNKVMKCNCLSTLYVQILCLLLNEYNYLNC